MNLRSRFRYSSVLAAMLGCIIFAIAAIPAASPTNLPPPESTSKVKRVLLYNKIGGWRSTDAIAHVNQYMASLAQAKGFALDTLSDETYLTLEFLKQYQVILWNNNTNGAASVPLVSARQAIVEYVNQGGGWFLIGLAGDHANSWKDLTTMMGTYFTRSASRGIATMQVDSTALTHPELRYVIGAIPHSIILNDTWMAFQNTVRPLPGVTVLYTAHGPKDVMAPMEDGSGDHVYTWARTIESGKLLYCSPGGWSSVNPSPIYQSDSAVAKLYWYSMRWLAGDFQNGCTDPSSPLFNPEARVDDGSCFPGNLRIERRVGRKGDQRRIRHSLAPQMPDAEGFQNRDIRGKRIYNFQVGLPKLVEE